MSSKSAGTNQARGLPVDSKKKQQDTGCGANNNNNNKKQAIPSQKRANHERQSQQNRRPQQQQQQQHQQRRQAQTGSARKLDGQGGELDSQASQRVADKSELCKERILANLNEFSRRGGELKADIEQALKRQVAVLEGQASVSENVEQLRRRMLELSQQPLADPLPGTAVNEALENGQGEQIAPEACEEVKLAASTQGQQGEQTRTNDERRQPEQKVGAAAAVVADGQTDTTFTSAAETCAVGPPAFASDQLPAGPQLTSDCFEPLTARLDPESKLVALKAGLERHFARAPELLEPICARLLMLSRQMDALVQQNDQQQSEIAKLTLIKAKLGDLCRELQRSNNEIRIESLAVLKDEQQKAREQAGKIQATLASVMKLFDENQQKNLSLKQENVELQDKLRALLGHCGQWEQCVETALKQRDIENCLIKTELKRLNLVRTEEQERFLKDKQDLLRVVEVMRSHQGKIEDKEAKLREDLSSYAGKYDECQEIIQKGLGKFRAESKRMLKQIEKSRQDYLVLLNKYELSNKKIKELLEEKQTWVKSVSQANKKVETLERLCRSLKQENDRLHVATGTAQGEAAPAPVANAEPASDDDAAATAAGPAECPVVVITADASPSVCDQ